MGSVNIDIEACRYKAMIGVGGIGGGRFFFLEGNQTLGREESRSGRFLDRRDYCKLHIISHYVKALLGESFAVIPLGKIGDDDTGRGLLDEMREAGLHLEYVHCIGDSPTLFSFCFVYPDGSGGNMTTNDSACSKVDAAFVQGAEPEFIRFAGKGIALAAPEVPLEAREKLLDLASMHHLFRVASFTSEEMRDVVSSDLLRRVDLLSVNLDEAAAAAGMPLAGHAPPSIVKAAAKVLSGINPEIKVSITFGKEGSWSWDGASLTYLPAYKANVVSTAGAGDAYLAGLIAGFTAGLSLQEAQQLATLAGGVSVESPHTINKNLGRESLRALAASSENIGKNVYRLLED